METNSKRSEALPPPQHLQPDVQGCTCTSHLQLTDRHPELSASLPDIPTAAETRQDTACPPQQPGLLHLSKRCVLEVGRSPESPYWQTQP